MFILDSFEYTSDYNATHKPTFNPDEWHIGGGGTYAAIGARMWLRPEQILMIIHKGQDFPPEVEQRLLSYSPSLFTFVSDPSHPRTTRALNTYSNTRRDFKYLTPKRQLGLFEIASYFPKFVHHICSPIRMKGVIEDLKSIRTLADPRISSLNLHQLNHWKPRFIYEPVPDSCVPENLDTLVSISGSMEVFSPNELEARSLLGLSTPTHETPVAIEDIARRFIAHGFRNVVIRCGKLGAFVVGSESTVGGAWIPAMIENQSEVVDQTGGGNSFLGGLMAGLAQGFDLVEASYCGSVSAGLTISQSGLPVLSINTLGHEVWGTFEKTPVELKAALKARNLSWTPFHQIFLGTKSDKPLCHREGSVPS
ncbi:hypothetical protein CROQUDRAFT_674331 [Cronartium quercuum f. sp. fusiforme G11]|uniref:Carbohydrate kinase PfkB domain-containing protein n=1 Tax=Cronartium quercuum f. sp. fusiforme G11 TaxID=708437 RepID=A0A9P6N8N0_9BASI|nr:hypothetical protein CROQUDRAFT_674331 [Cronartium quercuum f. sp. fusiforme G11]